MSPRLSQVAAWLVIGLAPLAARAAEAAAEPLGLYEAWQAALKHDRIYAAAAAARQAGQARGDQARALWRPNVQLQATAGRAGAETASDGAQFAAPGFGQSTGVHFGTSVNSGTSTQWVLQARQPLWSGQRSAQSEQLSLAEQASEVQWRGEQQALKLRVAERYFDVVLAAARLQVLQGQAEAVDRATQETLDRFRLGDVPVTDTHEATARQAALQVQVLAAQTELQVRRGALAAVSGTATGARPVALAARDLVLPGLPPLEQALAEARADSPLLQGQALQVRVAEQERAKQRALGSAAVDLVAQVGRDRLSGQGDFGAAANRSSQRMVGVQLTVPLYTGGWRSARADETAALQDEATARAEQARLDVAEQTRATWLSLAVAESRLKALAQAQQASQQRLAATQLGREVGHRTTLDLLNAHQDAAQADLALAQGRIDLLLQRLRLAALAGHLDDPTFETLDHSWQLAARP